jgi:puromycin-sensitive aminopeptidase
MAIYAEDAATQARFRELYVAYLNDRAAVDPNLLANVIYVSAYTAQPSEFDQFLARYKAAQTPQERNQYLDALTAFRDRDVIRRLLALTLTDEIRTAEGPGVLGSLLRSPTGGDLAWAFVKEHWDAILSRFSPPNIPSVLYGLTALSTPELAADVEQFFASHPLEAGARPLAQSLERLRVNVGFRQREAANLARYFQ